jgi:hypothetical protein
MRFRDPALVVLQVVEQTAKAVFNAKHTTTIVRDRVPPAIARSLWRF